MTSTTARQPRLDITVVANIRALIPDIEEDEQHLYDEYENLPILHFDSCLSLQENNVDRAKKAIQDFIWNTFGKKIFKNGFYMNLLVPPGTPEIPHGIPHRVSFDSPMIELLRSFQLPYKTTTLRMEAKPSERRWPCPVQKQN